MYAYLQGKLAHKDPTFAIIDVQGVGYEVRISLTTYNAIGSSESCRLHTHLYVKEDAQLLFGFAEANEKRLFLDLISISGVGPSLGLTILSSMDPEEIKAAIVQGDAKTIQRIKGIGAKTAQRLVLELQDRIKKEMTSGGGVLPEKIQGITSGSYNTLRNEALSALITLGINRNTAEKSIQKAVSEWQKSKSTEPRVEDLIKLALKTT